MSPPARSGPPNDPRKPQQTPPPRWLHWLWIIGLVVTIGLLFGIPAPSTTTTKSLDYTTWRADVAANQVKTAKINNSNGNVSGALTNGTNYTSRIPIALNDQSLTQDLLDHHVTVTATSTGTTFLSVLGSLLPFALLLLLYLWISRRATRQLT